MGKYWEVLGNYGNDRRDTGSVLYCCIFLKVQRGNLIERIWIMALAQEDSERSHIGI